MKVLNGSELAGFIKERQAKAVRALRQADKIIPKLAIIQCIDDPIIDMYVRLKKKYGSDILIEVDVHRVNQKEVRELIETLNNDDTVHGIIVQLPIENREETDEIVNLVNPDKDVDALGKDATADPATPTAILWLLAGYGIEFAGKHVLLLGKGKLVGAPLYKMLTNSGIDVTVADRSTDDLAGVTLEADIIVTATGSPAILFPSMIKQGAIVVDAGVASEDGRTVGDLHESVYAREDLTLTPVKGGVGPLTVCALFENVIKAARYKASQTVS